MYQVTVTSMQEHITDKSNLNREFPTHKEAGQYFNSLCDNLNLDNSGGQEAGGRGYDYRVEIIEA